MTVFIVPPRNVALKVGDQLLGRGEGIVAFLAAEMPMIAFACFVVEPQNALTVYDVCEPVLERVIRFFNYLPWRPSKSPQTFMNYAGMTMEERDPLVAEWANTIRTEEVPTASAPKT